MLSVYASLAHFLSFEPVGLFLLTKAIIPQTLNGRLHPLMQVIYSCDASPERLAVST